MDSRRLLPGLATALLLASSAAAQSTGLRSAGFRALARHDGAVVGAGDAFRAEFDERGFELVPALGEAAPRSYPLRFELESIRRGETNVPVELTVEPSIDGLLVRYPRSPTVEERYEVRREGVAQSFVFAEPLPGDGPLVVRGRLSTELALPPDGEHDDGFAGEAVGLGGVAWGGVTGVAADGATAPGGLRLVRDDDVYVELSLPAELVDGASYPLVLDPVIGPIVEIGGSSALRSPDAAYEPTTDKYLVVYEVVLSASNSDIWARTYDSTLTTVGSTILVAAGSTFDARNPAVAAVNGSDAFVVVYERTSGGDVDVATRKVLAASESVSGAVVVDTASGTDALFPDVGGESDPAYDTAMVTWEEGGTIFARPLQVTAGFSAPVVLGTPVSVSTSVSAVGEPAITKSAGPTGIHAIAYTYNSLGSGTLVGMRAIDRAGVFVTGSLSSGNDGWEASQPDVASDGTYFYWAFRFHDPATTQTWVRHDVFSLLSGSWDIIDLGSFSVGPSDVAPAMGFDGHAPLVAYEDSGFFVASELRFSAFDPFGDHACETTTIFSGSDSSLNERPEIASQWSGGEAGSEALVVWRSDLDNGDVRLARISADTGVATDLGGGCSTARARVGCLVPGNNDFVHRLVDAPANAPAWLLFSASTFPLACGPCTLVPDVFDAFVFATTASSDGEAVVSMAIPNDSHLSGLGFLAQWALGGNANCPFFGVDLSNALYLQIQ